VTSQPRYGEGEETIAHKASCIPCPFHLPFPSYCDVAQARRSFASSIIDHGQWLDSVLAILNLRVPIPDGYSTLYHLQNSCFIYLLPFSHLTVTTKQGIVGLLLAYCLTQNFCEERSKLHWNKNIPILYISIATGTSETLVSTYKSTRRYYQTVVGWLVCLFTDGFVSAEVVVCYVERQDDGE
jgi:hypothetical protein